MIYIKTRRINADKELVTTQHSNPSILPQYMLDEGLLVEDIPEPQVIPGKMHELYRNPKTGDFWYEYTDIPLSEDEITKKEINSLKLENAELMFKSAMTDIELDTIKSENAEMLFRLATMEMGVEYNV